MNFNTTEPKARKPYRCYLCEREIKIGEQHKKHVGSYEGDFYSIRAHIKCDEVTKDWEVDDYEHTEPCEFRKLLEEKEGWIMCRVFEIAEGVTIHKGAYMSMDEDGYFKECEQGEVWCGTAGEDLTGPQIELRSDSLMYNKEEKS